MPSYIHIVLTPDENYAVHAGVVVCSVLKQMKNPERAFFHIMEGDRSLSKEVHRNYQFIANQYSAKLEFIKFDSKVIDDLQIGKGAAYASAATYYRFLIPEFLCREDKCLYLDSDLVVMDDISDLWNEDISSVALGAVRDWRINTMRSYTLPGVRHYFNAGVLLMNLRKFRENNYIQQCLQLATIPEYVQNYADQDVLNIVCADNFKLLNPRWNIQSDEWRANFQPIAAEWKMSKNRPGIAHYTGKEKPWNFSLRHYFASEYWETWLRTPWATADEFKSKQIYYRVRKELFKIKRNDFLKNFFSLSLQPKKGSYRLLIMGLPVVNIQSGENGT